ncbi:MAG: ATP-binding cassette domain-containing protein, partial [Caldilineaceae bacterium]|nr:ATP-binding cassette domain-containing protein [Caldilineaceae bacterium]
LFNLISGLAAPSAGQIHFAGQDITAAPAHVACRMGIGRTFQIMRPFRRLTVEDNVRVGVFLHVRDASAAERQAREIVERVGLGPFAATPAHALTTAALKRLELARALATQPRLLLLDEVMAGLTPTESASIVALIQQIRAEGMTVLLIEHVMKAIMSLSDRVVVLHHGEVIAAGAPAAVVSDPRVVEAYLGEDIYAEG